MNETTTKPAPAKLRDEHLLFLDSLRESGATNMYGARPYLERKFKTLTGAECGEILAHWMRTFSDRHPGPNVAIKPRRQASA